VQGGDPAGVACDVGEMLADRWSPEQVAGWLKTTYPDDPEMQVSHETIYRTLFIQSRVAFRKELTAHSSAQLDEVFKELIALVRDGTVPADAATSWLDRK
jgi:IS30 family transposase